MKTQTESGRCLVTVIAVVVLLAVIGKCAGDGGGHTRTKSPPKVERPSKVSAWIMSQEFVKQNLKSPSTADFGSVFGDFQSYEDVVTVLHDGRFVVKAWVDAENAFGATLRSRFTCVIEHVGNDRWRLVNLEFE